MGVFLDKLPLTEEEARQYRQRGISYPGYQSLYFTPDGRHALVVIKTQAVSALSADGKRLLGYARGVRGAKKQPSPGAQQSISATRSRGDG